VFDDLAAGWPAMLSILMIGFGITNISLGILPNISGVHWMPAETQVFIIDDIKDLKNADDAPQLNRMDEIKN